MVSASGSVPTPDPSHPAAPAPPAPQTAPVPAERLRKVAAGILHALGAPAPYADQTAALLVEADLRGVDSHGTHLLGLYASRIRAGHLHPAAAPRVVRDGGATLLLDGGLGLGQVAGLEAVRLLVDRTRRHGVAAVAVREGTHLGALAAYTERAARAGVVCLCFQNGPTLVPPHGGLTPLFSTNPLSYAVPAHEEPPVVYDVATTAVAGNKLLLARKRGDATIPDGWANDTRGRPTTDPAAASVDHLRWFGGHKGFGLAVLVELLAGALTGSCFGATEDTASPAHGRERVAKGFVFLGLDPERFLPGGGFAARVDTLVREIRASEPADGVDRVLVPGQLEHERRAVREAEGIPLPDALREEINQYAAELGAPGLD
ncbi:Ldh family oxidoreductase [Yinghuangia seranimata]|uniref:Ldh family oxidoreductase n=1 Tax=Yinghuangia seranimata TaxID=408067 RepID=UPI00248B3076|nr:Ldh family oxidoreductase [Yinghuangia seranimata]MDI2129877.1 Ldh family oxidoreductase [Yinghuangia seranimata]